MLDLPKKDTLISTTEVREASSFCSPMVHTKTSVKKSKKRRSVLSSTPVSNPDVASKTPHSVTSIFNDSNLYSTEKQFLVALRGLEPLPQKWESGHILSCKAFTDLATCILQCSQGRMPDCLSQVDIPVEAVCLMRQGNYDQAVKICHGYAIEMSFSLVETHLTHMTRCISQLKTWVSGDCHEIHKCSF
ncbi:hypothetical protein P879_08743 [Paragonimus westermani]|uniref:Uncharacterized protein n=1 Tax=Paragonimus westermani TaxID=34504 RepID=A0A8T0DEK4_9TREM|nr:hypothetical protein P879_08743 [Paragonimus westermani]